MASGVDGRFEESSIAFIVEASIYSSVPTAAESVFLTFGLIEIFFFGVTLAGFFFAEREFFLVALAFGFGFSSSSSFSSGAEPWYFAALVSMSWASISPAKAAVASLLYKSLSSSLAFLSSSAFFLAAATFAGSILSDPSPVAIYYANIATEESSSRALTGAFGLLAAYSFSN